MLIVLYINSRLGLFHLLPKNFQKFPAFTFVLLKARSSNMADIAVHLSNSDVGLTLPPHKCPSLIAIFEDGLDQLAILAGIEPDVSKTDNRPVKKTYYQLIVLYNLVG